MSDNNQLKLLQFTATSFAGIDKSSPVIICFPQGYGGYVVFKGDQATHKTSGLEAFKAVCGIKMPDNAINRKDNDRRLKFDFERGDKKYKVSVSKTRFELELLADPKRERWAKLSTPQTMVKDILGPVGISPMFLKGYKGKDQIDWLKNFFRLDEDALELEAKIEGELKLTYKSRRDTNRDLKKYENMLSVNDYHLRRDFWEEKIKETDDTSTEEKIKDVQKRFNLYNRAVSEVETQKNKKSEIDYKVSDLDNEIEELNKKIKEKTDLKESLVKLGEEVDTRISTGEAWIKDNKSIEEENQNIGATIKEKEQLATHRANFMQMDELKKTTDHLHDEYIRLENRLDALRVQKKELVAAFTPNIEGLEVCIPDTGEVEEGDEESDKKPETREGLFYNGCSPLELSESELWGLYAQLLEKLDIRIIVIDNINSLGSNAIELFERFIAAGGYVLASEMKRSEKNLKVIVQNKIIETLEEEEDEQD